MMMEEPQEKSSGTTESAGSSEGDQSSARNVSTIDPKDHKQAIDDLMKYKRRSQELETRLNKLESAALEEKEDYKSLWEQEVANHSKTKEKASNLTNSVYNLERYNAVYPKLKELGLKDEARKILEKEDLSTLEVETTDSGRFLVHGADTFVERFKTDYPFAFQDKSAPNVNPKHSYRSADSGRITADDLIKLESSDPEKYQEMLTKYVKQRKEARTN